MHDIILPGHGRAARALTRFAIFVPALLLACFSAALLAAEPIQRAEAPAVESMRITPLAGTDLDGNNARIDVVYAREEKLPDALPIHVDDHPVTLKRERANQFVAYIPFSFDAFVKDQERRQKVAQTQMSVPVFRGRELVEHRLVRFIDPKRLREAIAKGESIEVPEDVLFGLASTINAATSLMVVNPRVVEDPDRTFDVCTGFGNPDGAWTFKTLMTHMANPALTGIDPGDFVEDWLKSWLVQQNVNTFDIDKRPAMAAILDPHVWPRDGAGHLILKEAPMRLLAIVNRIDLRDNSVYGEGNAGEGRFVFGVMRRLPDGSCSTMPFTVILEYGVPLNKCEDIRDYGQKWVDLDGLVLGSPAYNASLQNLTDLFTSADAAPDKPNGSAINQVRTNENALDPLWELRQFELPPAGGLLRIVSTSLTPHRATYNPFPAPPTSTLLGDFVNLNQGPILADAHTVPDIFLGEHFLTGSALNPDVSPAAVWKHPLIVDNDARHKFSLNTCDACHGGETATRFLHVEPRNMGVPALLSRFLIGSPGSVASPGTFSMPDPVSGVTRTYGDLQMRQASLDALVGSSCRASSVFLELAEPFGKALSH